MVLLLLVGIHTSRTNGLEINNGLWNHRYIFNEFVIYKAVNVSESQFLHLKNGADDHLVRLVEDSGDEVCDSSRNKQRDLIHSHFFLSLSPSLPPSVLSPHLSHLRRKYRHLFFSHWFWVAILHEAAWAFYSSVQLKMCLSPIWCLICNPRKQTGKTILTEVIWVHTVYKFLY